MMLPDMDGLDVLRRLREIGSTPIVIFSAQDEEASRIVGLEMGADDYVPKAFSPRELLARETLDESDIRQLTQGLVRN